MDFRLEASLWQSPAAPRPEAGEADSGRDFKQKLDVSALGADKRNDPEPAAPEEAPSPEMIAEMAFRSLAESTRRRTSVQAVRREGIEELYTLGLQAKGHLSYQAGLFGPEVAALAAALPKSEAGERTGKGQGGTEAPLQAFSGTAGARSPVSGQSFADRESVLRVAAPEGQRALSARLAEVWPDRRFQLVEREQGVDLMVRDYHLSAEDEDALADELVRYMKSRPQQTGSLWLNGRLVWSSEYSMDARGERNGH